MTLDIATKLMELRKQHNLSQEELAEKIGVSRQAVSKWERAEASPDTDNLILLARLYGVSLDQLLATTSDNESIKQNIKSNTEKSKATSSFSCALMIAVTYVIIGIAAGKWHPWWILFLLVPIFDSLVRSIVDRKTLSETLLAVPYPVLVTAIYLWLGFAINGWHPWWVIYLTVPVYYSIATIANTNEKSN